MGKWKETKLGDEIVILTDYTANGSFESLKQNVQYYNDINYAVLVRTTDLGKSIFKPERYTDRKGYSFLKTVHLFGGEIVIANVGSLGKVYRVPFYPMSMVLAPNMYLLKFKESIDEDYIFQYLISSNFKDSLLKVIGSTTLQAVNKDNLRSIKFKLPEDKPEQTRIAEILSTTDKSIAVTEALIAKYQRIKSGLMKDLLSRGIDENGNIRSKATHKFVVKNGIEVPEEWVVKPLKYFLNYISYGFTNPMPESQDGPFMVTAANINDGRIIYEGCRHTTKEAFDRLLTEKSRPKLNDILITKDGSLGRLAIVVEENLCINQSVAVLRPRQELVKIKFLKQLLESPAYQATIISEAGGSTIKHIYITKLDRMQTAIPKSETEQLSILELLNEHNIYIENLQTELSKLKSLKTGLMQDLLSGKISVNVGNYKYHGTKN